MWHGDDSSRWLLGSPLLGSFRIVSLTLYKPTLVPPSYSTRKAIRYSYSQSIASVGSILAEILSHANDYHAHLGENVETRNRLLACRTKLSKVS
jgi:hypothetical protein